MTYETQVVKTAAGDIESVRAQVGELVLRLEELPQSELAEYPRNLVFQAQEMLNLALISLRYELSSPDILQGMKHRGRALLRLLEELAADK